MRLREVTVLAQAALLLLTTACSAGTQPVVAGVFQLAAVPAAATSGPAFPVVGQPPDQSRQAERPATGPSAGGGSADGGSAPAAAAWRVLDRQGHPIPGATVLFADGARFQTGGDGSFALSKPAPQATCVVFAPGYKTSVVAATGLPEVLHLDRLPSADPGFEPGEVTVRGTVAWGGEAPGGGVVLYQDDRGSVANPVVVDGEGRFVLQIETRRPGPPTGMILALSAGAHDVPLMGLSRPFSVLEQGSEPVVVTTIRASRRFAFEAGTPPAGLPEVSHRLEIAIEGLAPFRMMGAGATAGEYALPEPGALGATLRVAVEAANPAIGARSVVTIDPDAPGTHPTTFLALPELTVQPQGRVAAWKADPAARAVLLEVAQSPRLEEAYWEGWFEGRQEHRFETRDWPAGPAIARLVAFDAPQGAARRVASFRALRLLPEPGWRGGYRFAEARAPFAPQ